MKIKSLLIFTISAFATANVLANSMSGGKLISHTEFGAPNIKLTYKDQPNKKNFPGLLKKSKNIDVDQVIQSSDKIQTVEVFSHEGYSDISAEGPNVISFFNETPTSQTYTVTRSACVVKYSETEEMPEQCSSIIDLFEIDAHLGYAKMGFYNMSWSNAQPGEYIIIFRTIVQNNNSSTLFASYDVQAVTVPTKK